MKRWFLMFFVLVVGCSTRPDTQVEPNQFGEFQPAGLSTVEYNETPVKFGEAVTMTAAPPPTQIEIQPLSTIIVTAVPPTVSPVPTFSTDNRFGYDAYNLDAAARGPNGEPQGILSEGRYWCYSSAYAVIGMGPWHLAGQQPRGGDEFACIKTAAGSSQWVPISQAPPPSEPMCHRTAPLINSPCDEARGS